MTDRPILFSAPMIRAILREIAAPGTGKTQTRRIIHPYEVVPHPFKGAKAAPSNLMVVKVPARLGGFIDGPTFSPRFAPGDRLWVREAFSYDRLDVDRDGILPPWYWADGNPDAGDWTRPKPSIHMPRWASRLTLHVTDLRVQRLQEISEADARAEGIEPREIRPVHDIDQPAETWWFGTENGRASAKSAFRDLWDSLNAERAPWSSNPWVVAVSFRPVLGNIDRVAA